MFTDLHTHILPEMDDGAKSVESSVKMLRALHSQGVNVVAVTPHFKLRHNDNVNDFLARRNLSYNRIMSAVEGVGGLPDIKLGAEVALSTELPQLEGLDRLCYEGTRFLLIELDPAYIGPWVINSLYEISARYDVIPVIAHVDRYFDALSGDLLDKLAELNYPIQFNAEVLENFWYRRKLKKLIKHHTDCRFVVGTDCHGNRYRKPNMDIFASKGAKLLGKEIFDEICENSRQLINGTLIV